MQDQQLAPYTSFKIGGTCKMLIKPRTITALKPLIQLLKQQDVPYYFLGNGSNMLVSSGGFDGAVIVISDNLNKIEVMPDNKIYCEAGTGLSKLCKTAQANGFSGIEFAYGIPGTVGGAIYMNAGAYCGEIKDVLHSCTFIDPEGDIITLKTEQMEFSYRHSVFSGGNYCILSALFTFREGDSAEIKLKMDGYLASRKEKQPLEYPSAGSTFKRPDGNYASALIEQCGLKGSRVGDAMVSEKHSGFIVNVGSATSYDVTKLVEYVRTVVQEKTGYLLECEMKRIGD